MKLLFGYKNWKKVILAKNAWGGSVMEQSVVLMEQLVGWKQEEQEKVFCALELAISAHGEQKRKSGEPYVLHPIAVALKAKALGLDADALCACLLHDTVEDTGLSILEIEKRFGESVALMVDAMTKIAALSSVFKEKHIYANVQQAETLRKMLIVMSQDVRALIIKLCDRWHNLKTLGALPRKKQLRIIKETQEIYAPLASRLGMEELWGEIQELCFMWQYPLRYRVLVHYRKEQIREQQGWLSECVAQLEGALKKERIKATISGRHKSVISIYQKMKEKKLKFQGVLDKEGVRIIVKEKKDCYWVLGIIHELWRPIPGTFKDYIAIPKMNGYQSLHSAVMNEKGMTLEVQIRTEKMHLMAEEGLAAHWHYKDKNTQELNHQWSWLQSLLEIQAQSDQSEDFLEHIRTDLFAQEVYVFTASGEIITLPRGASLIDFGFAIHSQMGIYLESGQVNGVPVDLSYKLKNGERVIVHKAAIPKVDISWLQVAKTGRARSHIRAYLKEHMSQESKRVAWSLIESALELLGQEQLQIEEWAWDKVWRAFGAREEDVVQKIVLGQISALVIAQQIAQKSTKKGVSYQKKKIYVTGSPSEHIKSASCCTPVSPELIVGVLKVNEGLIIHKQDCERVGQEQGVLLEVQWDPLVVAKSFEAVVRLLTKNERGVLARVSALIAQEGADVNNVKVLESSSGEASALIEFDLQVSSALHLERIKQTLQKEPFVKRVLS